jgi:hypothetical protein
MFAQRRAWAATAALGVAVVVAGFGMPAGAVAASASSQVEDTTVSDFNAGTVGAGIYIAKSADGEVTLAPTVGAEFEDPELPAGWSSTPWADGGTSTIGGGRISVDGALVGPDTTFGPGRSLRFVATFAAKPFEHVGFATDFSNAPWAIFSTGTSGTALQARTFVPGGTMNDTTIPGDFLGQPHEYRIDWTADGFDFYIDESLVASHADVIQDDMRPLVSDFNLDGTALTVDWLRLSPYASTGTFLSRVFDAGATANWGTASWTPEVPAGTSLTISARTGNTPTPDGTWSAFAVIPASGDNVGQTGRYLQYGAELDSADPAVTPSLDDITISSAALTPRIDAFSPSAARVGKLITITGANFADATVVTFDGVPATFSVVSDSEIDASVPKGALTGPIAVSSDAGTGTSATDFLVKPKIGRITPSSGPVGASVRIKGSALTRTSRVTFHGVDAAFTVDSYTVITATVPAGATTGRIRVFTDGGTAKSGTFTVTG